MLVKTAGYEVAGNMPGESIDMSLSADSLDHIMDILSDLYSNRPAAIVREYGTNAIDAHIISGQNLPVKITTPNRLNPNLIIQDFGAGMSKQVLMKTYSKYGASTKRGNDLEAGQLGLGSKSGFAYTDQFTVRSVHDGHCCELIMSRNDRGTAEMTVVFDYATEDHSGVTITIPIKSTDVYAVEQEANKFAMFATPGTVEVDNELNKIPESWTKVADNLYATNSISHHMVVMGNVAYPADLFKSTWVPYRGDRLIAFVEMGQVDFPPSREALKYTFHTEKTIDAIETYMHDSIAEQVKEDVGENKSRQSLVQAYQKTVKWHHYVAVKLPGDISLDDVARGTEHTSATLPVDIDNSADTISNYNANVRKRTDVKPNMAILEIANKMDTEFYAVTDYEGVRLTRDQARKILSVDSDFAGREIILFQNGADEVADLFNNWKHISWNDVKKIKLRKTPTATSVDKVGDEYNGVHVHNRRLSSEKLMKTNGPAYYISRSALNEIRTTGLPRGDYKVFIVAAAKQKAFVNKNPHAKSLKEYVNNRRKQINKHIENSEHVKNSLSWSSQRHVFRWVDFTKVTNQDFLNKVKLGKTGYKWCLLSGSSSWYSSNMRSYLEDNYPLIQGSPLSTRTTRNHAMQYVNMIGENNVSA